MEELRLTSDAQDRDRDRDRGTAGMRAAERRTADTARPDAGRSRPVEPPGEISAYRWNILLHVYHGIADDRILANAAAVTFFTLLALFPATAALVSIYGLFADPASIAQQLSAVSGILPGGAIEVIRDQLTRLVNRPPDNLGVGFVVGLAVALWSANGGIKALFDALNTVYEEEETRSFIAFNAISLAFTVAMTLFFIVAIACIVAIPVALDYLPGFIGMVLNFARWPIITVIVAAVLAGIYHYGPSRTGVRWRWITWGSVVAAFLWLGASALFSFYAANFGSFNKTYGSLGAVIGFMLWLWLSVIVILLGGKLNAEIERQATGQRDRAAVAPDRSAPPGWSVYRSD